MRVTELNVTIEGSDLQDILFTPVIEGESRAGWRVIETRGETNVGLAPAIQKILRKSTGCGSINSVTMTPTAKNFVPVQMKGRVSFCAENLQATIFQAGRNAGVKRSEVDGTIFAALLQDVAVNGVMADLNRVSWLGNTGSSDADYQQFNGIWKQVLADSDITEYTGYSNAPLASGDSVEMFIKLMTGANTGDAMKEVLSGGQYGQAVIHCSSSVYNNYLEYLESFGNVEGSYRLLQDGSKALMFRGAKLVEHPEWNTTNCTDSDISFNGATADFNLALLTVETNLVFAVDSTDPSAQIKLWYDDDAELTYAKSAVRAIAGYVTGLMITAAI